MQEISFGGASAKILAEVGLESFNKKMEDVVVSKSVSRKTFGICLLQGTNSKPLEDVLDSMPQSSLWEKGVDEKFVASLIGSKYPISSAQSYALGLPDDNRNKDAVIA